MLFFLTLVENPNTIELLIYLIVQFSKYVNEKFKRI